MDGELQTGQWGKRFHPEGDAAQEPLLQQGEPHCLRFPSHGKHNMMPAMLLLWLLDEVMPRGPVQPTLL